MWINVLRVGEGDAEAKHRTRGGEPSSYPVRVPIHAEGMLNMLGFRLNGNHGGKMTF